jgi:two-component system cell cycle response regulator
MGDQVLRRVVELLQTDLPPRSFCARYGGEEFVLVLPGAAPEQAVALCERARHRIEGEDWSRLTPGLRVTVSSRLHAATRSGCNAVAFSVATDSPVQLAGAAARRRVVRDVDHAAAEECRSP